MKIFEHFQKGKDTEEVHLKEMLLFKENTIVLIVVGWHT